MQATLELILRSQYMQMKLEVMLLGQGRNEKCGGACTSVVTSAVLIGTLILDHDCETQSKGMDWSTVVHRAHRMTDEWRAGHEALAQRSAPVVAPPAGAKPGQGGRGKWHCKLLGRHGQAGGLTHLVAALVGPPLLLLPRVSP